MKIKKWFSEKPIAWKITFMYALLFSMVFIMISVFVTVNTWYYYKSTTREEIIVALDKVQEHIESGGATDKETINELNTNQYLKIIVTKEKDFRKRNEQLNNGQTSNEPQNNETQNNEPTKDNFAPGRLNPPRFNDPVGEPKRPEDTQIGDIGGKQFMFEQRIVEYDHERYCIQVFRPYYHETRVIESVGIIFFIVNIFGIVLAYVIGKKISVQFLKPIKNITETANNITINELSERIEVPAANDEIKDLVLTLNDMIERLEVSVEKQKQFVSDASHELRTPISVIQGYANLIDRWGKSDEDILQESIDSIKDETERMSSLITKLLFLAREEKGEKNIELKETELDVIAEEIVKEAKMVDETRQFEFESDGSTKILADNDTLKQLIWIFTENAIKYSDKENGKITVRVKNDGDKARLEIEDNGIGIKEDDLPYIFGRFYRADKSRSNDIPGTGLGLSIAVHIVKKLNAKVDVKSKYGEGSIFTVTFPIFKGN